jgi:hypothetical protein
MVRLVSSPNHEEAPDIQGCVQKLLRRGGNKRNVCKVHGRRPAKAMLWLIVTKSITSRAAHVARMHR